MPQSLEELSYLATTLAILLGGIWGVTTWIHQERLRKIREMPGLEARISFDFHSVSLSQSLLTIDIWTKNTGIIPIRPFAENARILLTPVELPKTEAFVQISDEPSDKSLFVYPAKLGVTLEPNTETGFHAFATVIPGRFYSVVFELPSDEERSWVWRKRRVVLIPPYSKTEQGAAANP